MGKSTVTDQTTLQEAISRPNKVVLSSMNMWTLEYNNKNIYLYIPKDKFANTPSLL